MYNDYLLYEKNLRSELFTKQLTKIYSMKYSKHKQPLNYKLLACMFLGHAHTESDGVSHDYLSEIFPLCLRQCSQLLKASFLPITTDKKSCIYDKSTHQTINNFDVKTS